MCMAAWTGKRYRKRGRGVVMNDEADDLNTQTDEWTGRARGRGGGGGIAGK